jgi:NAD(P)-dependent dehydrogenase (short-subunit alcohol dehydrogenase family)
MHTYPASVGAKLGSAAARSSVTGRVCVVTGASSGIGRQVALDLAQEGALVCGAARRLERLEQLVEEMGGRGRGHSAVRCDVSRRADVRALAEHVAHTYGRCDVLVNSAGFVAERVLHSPAAVDVVEAVMATNFLGAVACTAELLALLERAAPSSVVNVASMAGRVAVPGSGAYTASKFALVGWSEAIRPELGARGVHLSLVLPGFVPTEGFPAQGMVEHRLLRHALASVEDVSEAVRGAIARRAPERTVPRWYRILEVPRVLAPRLFRIAQGVAGAARQSKSRSEGSPSA